MRQPQLSLIGARLVYSPPQSTTILCPKHQGEQESVSSSPQAIVELRSMILSLNDQDQQELRELIPQAVLKLGSMFLHLTKETDEIHGVHTRS